MTQGYLSCDSFVASVKDDTLIVGVTEGTVIVGLLVSSVQREVILLIWRKIGHGLDPVCAFSES